MGGARYPGGLYLLPFVEQGRRTDRRDWLDYNDNPNVGSDLAVYRRHYGLPKAKFYKYNQDGQQGHYPTGQVADGREIDLDVEMVSAACPNCTIYLIESNNSGPRSTEKAESEAVTLGAHIVSNSGICEGFTGLRREQSDFKTPGVTYVAAAGDLCLRHRITDGARDRRFGRRHAAVKKAVDL